MLMLVSWTGDILYTEDKGMIDVQAIYNISRMPHIRAFSSEPEVFMTAIRAAIFDNQPHKVQARSLVCFWASRELGMSMVQLSKRLNISQPTVSQFATRGEKIAKENKLKLLQNK